MRRQPSILIGVALAALALAIAFVPCAGAIPATRHTLVVLTGGHDFDVKAFPALFEGYDDISVRIVNQTRGDEIFQDIGGWNADAIVLYNFNQKLDANGQKNFLALLEKGVGLVVVHHAIAAYQEWPEWNRILGARYYLKDETGTDGVVHPACTWKHDVDFAIRVEDATHPITAGVSDFAINDEVYRGYTVFPGAHVLLSTDEPQNNRSLAWWKTYDRARVVYLQLGHGPGAWANPSYRRLLVNAIRWSGRF